LAEDNALQNESDSLLAVQTPADDLPDNIDALKAALRAERQARQHVEARISASEAVIVHLKLLIAKLRREQYGQSSERGRQVLDQMELQLEDLEADAAETAVVPERGPNGASPQGFTRRRPVRAPLPEHLPRERVIVPAPSACPCCGGRLARLGEDVTETLEVVPRRWKVIQTVREKHLPVLRANHPAAGTVPPDHAGSCRRGAVGHGALCQVRPASAAEPAK
jgi:transposase